MPPPDAPTPPSPAGLFDLSVAYWRSASLFTALDLSLFATIGDDTVSLDDLCTSTGCPARSLSMLVDALVALELLSRDAAGGIRNTPQTRTFLCPGTPAYLGDAIGFTALSYPAWGKLTEAVRHATPTMSPQHFLGDDEAATRNFVLAMHGRALGVARCLVGLLDLTGRRRLLDLGGGPATYSALLVERFPELHSTVMDLPGVVAVARELVAESPARDRLELTPGDIFAADFGGGYDAVLISGVLHRTEGEGLRAMVAKAATALKPGGLFAISDLFTGGPSTGPVLPELFSLHMLVTNDTGRSLPLDEMADIYDQAGLTLTETIPYPSPLPHTLIVGTKR